MTAGAALTPRPCRDGCGTRVVLVMRQPSGRWGAFEAVTRNPHHLEAVGCWVLVGEQAWRPADLAEQFQTSRHLDGDTARDLVADYPHHRPHFHPRPEEDRDEPGTD